LRSTDIDAERAQKLAPCYGRSLAARWHISGDYFESCNCDAICPCRTVGSVPGGRSTHGICFGVLSWLVRDGALDGLGLSGLAAAFSIRYDDDEPRSPWDFTVYVDERGSPEQRDALAAILTGKLGGDVMRLPWNSKPSNEIAVRPARIDLAVAEHGNELRVGSAIELTASRPVETDERVSCGIPGHHIAGTEYYADRLAVDDAPFEWELSGNCAYVSTFAYSG
jgi:hypothetical protein